LQQRAVFVYLLFENARRLRRAWGNGLLWRGAAWL